VECIRQSCVRRPKKSVAHQSLELGFPKTTIQNVIHKRLRLYAYKIQLKHDIKPDEVPKHYDFASLMLNKIDEDETFVRQICFTDEATFHMNGCVNCHNCRIWGSEQPNEIREYVRGSAKVNVWCGLLCDHVVGFFFYSTITGGIYQDMVENYFFPQIEDLERETGNLVIFMQDGAHHFCQSVCKTLNEKFPNAWIGRVGPVFWPPRSYPDRLFFYEDTSRTLCMVKRFGISRTYRIGSQRTEKVLISTTLYGVIQKFCVQFSNV
jgi:ferredoxin-like protein FixX